MTTVLGFRCDALRSRLSVASCAANYNAANGAAKSYSGDAMRHGLHARQAGLAPCVGCALGAEHAETGKARNGLHLTVIGQAPVEAPKPLETLKAEPAKSFEDVKPSGIKDARPVSHAAITNELREIVQERIDSGATRNTPWTERAKDLAVELYERHGARSRELDAIGLNYFTVLGWVKKSAAARAGESLNQAVEDVPEPQPTRRLKPVPKAPAEAPAPAPIEEEPDMPEEEPTLPPAAKAAPSQAARIERALQVATGIALRSKPIAVDEDEIIDFCERAGLGFRMTQAVLAIVLRNPSGAFDILSRELARKGAAE